MDRFEKDFGGKIQQYLDGFGSVDKGDIKSDPKYLARYLSVH